MTPNHGKTMNKQLADLEEQLDNAMDLLALAFPYVDSACDDPCYKPDAVRPLANRIRKAIDAYDTLTQKAQP